MSDWAQKRFWTDVAVIEDGAEFTVTLDGRRIKTPAKTSFAVPTRRMAEMVAAEWNAQDGLIKPDTMPFTRSANAAIDKVRTQHVEVADMLAAYGDADLLCYRATSPEALVARQGALWDPALEWGAQTLGARLEPRSGLMHAAQDPEALSILSKKVHSLDAFQLAAFHDLVSLSGSLVLGFAATLNWRSADEIWQISRLDELWQAEQWGTDDDAESAAEIKRAAYIHAKTFYDFS
ncbi:MAG: ATP12 family chaperone protein [Sedimentitalea sp.]